MFTLSILQATRLRAASYFTGIILALTLFPSCLTKVHPPPSTQLCTFILSNIFNTCHNPTSSTGIIPYQVNFIIQYQQGNLWITLDEKTINSASPPSTSVIIHSKVPNDNTVYEVETTLTGGACARCALTQYGSSTCLQIPSGGAYSAGFPRWHYQSGPLVGGRLTYTISNWGHIDNVSCGCTVPN